MNDKAPMNQDGSRADDKPPLNQSGTRQRWPSVIAYDDQDEVEVQVSFQHCAHHKSIKFDLLVDEETFPLMVVHAESFDWKGNKRDSMNAVWQESVEFVTKRAARLAASVLNLTADGEQAIAESLRERALHAPISDTPSPSEFMPEFGPDNL